jgi:hypothetical protein
MANVTVPAAPALSRIPNVELIHTGTWAISTGVWTVTAEDIANAVAAMECPAVGRPILKLGHTDPRFDGEPAVGYISNVAAAEGGHTLVGDYEGMPGWLGPVIGSAYPNRSVEGQYDFRCAIGHTHPFVLTGVALLGVTAPGIGTLESLQDVGSLYGVAASRPQPGFTVHASVPGGAVMPNPQPLKVAATVTSEDVRRAFYEDASWSMWIEEIQLDPVMQLIVTNDDDGERSRVPITIGKGDGSDAVSFGTPIPVVVRYEDVPNEDTAEGVAASRIVYASRAESRPGRKPAATDYGNNAECATCQHLASFHADIAAGSNSGACSTTGCTCKAMVAAKAASRGLPAEPVEGTNPNPTPEVTMAEAAGTLSEGLRQRLGITDADVDEATLLAAVDEALAERLEPPKEPALPVAASSVKAPEGAVVIDSTTLELIQAQARRGDEAFARMAADDRDRTISAAVTDGKIARSRIEHWRTSWGNDPEGAKQALAAMPKGLVPVETFGGPGDPDSFSEEYASLFPKEA